ncbi:PD40 domain-containing protein [candidate division KSB1 bacterium]|nr:PD40 domain-containing protein [candidate division KSB1 bacterium]
MKKNTLILLLFLLMFSTAHGQFLEYNHPELNWRSIETEHFYVHFHQNESRTASLVAKIAEDIYHPLSELYQYEPDTQIHFVIRDHEDNANGAAFYYDNKVEIWAPPADFLLRGDHNWLRNVVTHELSHMLSLGAARKMPRQLPAVYFQWLDYEDEKRPDVLHGYPNTLMSMPLAGTIMPMWLAEGMAQFQRAGFEYDTWDTHRDMLLRTAVLEDDLLSITEMGIFGKNSVGNERVYNQGYALSLYIAQQFGEEKLGELARAMRTPWFVSSNPAIKRVLGKSESKLYNEWKSWLETGYADGIQPIQSEIIQGKIFEDKGIGNLYPIWSRDGKRVAYMSNRGEDYMSLRSLWITDTTLAHSKKIASGSASSASWSPDGKQIVFSRKVRERNGQKYFDLYKLDIESKKKTRITRTRRARLPDWSPDGKRIVCVIEQDGTSNLALVHPDSSGWKVITFFENGEQIFTPRWMPDSKQIIFAMFTGQGGRDIAMIDSSGSGFHTLIQNESDTRDPWPSPDGKSIFYANDESGIFNIHRYDLSSEQSGPVTNVTGGAFMPSANKNGQLVYSLFTSEGYKVAVLDTIRSLIPTLYESPYNPIRIVNSEKSWPIKQYNDRDVPEYESKPYKPVYAKMMFLPRVYHDYPGKWKLGTYFYSSDFLDQFSVFGTAAANKLFDSDVYTIFQYRKYTPTLFIELYQQRRHTTDMDIKYKYNLMGSDIGADWKLSESDELRTAYQFSRYDATMTLKADVQDIDITYTYHTGNAIQLRWFHQAVEPTMHSVIAPSAGRKIELETLYSRNNFIEGFEVHTDYGTLVETYVPYNYFQCQLDWREYVPSLIPSHSVALRLKAGWIDRNVDSFYDLFAGGLDGLRGYPYYSIEGRKLLQFGAAYRFPIWRKTGLRFLFINIDQIWGSVYADIGDAWNSDKTEDIQWRRDAGAQLRMNLFGFYGFPLRFFMGAAYGLDTFERVGVQYGHEWRPYFGLLFDFLD